MMSCITAVMDREQALEQMLPSWTKVEKIKDFVIVDWNSPKPIIENSTIQKQMKEYGNIKIIRVEDEKYFYRCLAWNLAFQNTNPENKILLKLDADYINLNDSWMNHLHLYQPLGNNDVFLNDYFITGSYQFMSCSLGFLLVNKKDFGLGYNENLQPVWGFEDEDIIKRIEKQFNPEWKNYREFHKGWDGLKRIIFFNMAEYVYHIPHSFKARFKNLLLAEDILSNGFNPDKMWNLAKVNQQIAQISKTWIPAKYETLEDSPTYKRVKLIKK